MHPDFQPFLLGDNLQNRFEINVAGNISRANAGNYVLCIIQNYATLLYCTRPLLQSELPHTYH